MAGLIDQRAGTSDIFRRLHEAQRHEVHAEAEAEVQVVDVFLGQRRRRQRHAGRVDAFVSAERSPVDDDDLETRRGSSNDLELDPPVVEQQAIARLRRSHELGVGGEDAARLARRVTRGDDERLALLQLQRPIAGERAGANLRSAQILHDADVPAGARGNLADVGEGLGMGLVRAVREVEPEHIDAGGHERGEHFAASARRTDGGDDFGVTHYLVCHGAPPP